MALRCIPESICAIGRDGHGQGLTIRPKSREWPDCGIHGPINQIETTVISRQRTVEHQQEHFSHARTRIRISLSAEPPHKPLCVHGFIFGRALLLSLSHLHSTEDNHDHCGPEHPQILSTAFVLIPSQNVAYYV